MVAQACGRESYEDHLFTYLVVSVLPMLILVHIQLHLISFNSSVQSEFVVWEGENRRENGKVHQKPSEKEDEDEKLFESFDGKASK